MWRNAVIIPSKERYGNTSNRKLQTNFPNINHSKNFREDNKTDILFGITKYEYNSK